VRYADDIVLPATTEQVLQRLVDRLSIVSKKYGSVINADKTKVTTTEDKTCGSGIFIERKKIEQVDTFLYLGSLITDDVVIFAVCSKEIRARLKCL